MEFPTQIELGNSMQIELRKAVFGFAIVRILVKLNIVKSSAPLTISNNYL